MSFFISILQDLTYSGEQHFNEVSQKPVSSNMSLFAPRPFGSTIENATTSTTTGTTTTTKPKFKKNLKVFNITIYFSTKGHDKCSVNVLGGK